MHITCYSILKLNYYKHIKGCSQELSFLQQHLLSHGLQDVREVFYLGIVQTSSTVMVNSIHLETIKLLLLVPEVINYQYNEAEQYTLFWEQATSLGTTLLHIAYHASINMPSPQDKIYLEARSKVEVQQLQILGDAKCCSNFSAVGSYQ